MSQTLPAGDRGGTVGRKRARRCLWLVLCLTLPLPFWTSTAGFAPPVRPLFVSTLIGGIALGAPNGPLPFFLAALLTQAVVGIGLMYLLARLLLRVLAESDGAIRARRLAAIVLSLLVMSLFSIYRIPLGSSGTRANLLGLFG